MTFVQTINPFNGILCVPIYYIWILILISWILTYLESLFIYFIGKYRKKLLNQLDNLEIKVNITIRDEFELELEKISIDHMILPNDIISIIMSMLPQKNEHWKDYKYYKDFKKSTHQKLICLKCLLIIYPIIRFISNFINLIIILLRYIYWYNDNNNLSN